MWFNMTQVDELFLKTAPWKFQMRLELPNLDADTCWKMFLKDENWQHWHPEVHNINWYDDKPQQSVGAMRSVVFHDALFDVLLMGGCALEEKFDVWDNEGRKLGFTMTKIGRPTLLTYKSVREEFHIEDDGKGGCIFHRKVAVDPSFITKNILGFAAYPRLKDLFEKKCPERFETALAKGKLMD